MFEGFAQLRQFLTVSMWLRRIARELHRANDLAEARLDAEYPNMYAAFKRRKLAGSRPRRPIDISVPTVESWNKNYLDKNPPLDEDDLSR